MSELVKTMIPGKWDGWIRVRSEEWIWRVCRAYPLSLCLATQTKTLPVSPPLRNAAPLSPTPAEEEDGETDQQEIPLPNVESVILGKVMEFCKHYCEEPMNEIEKPLKSSSMHEVVQ